MNSPQLTQTNRSRLFSSLSHRARRRESTERSQDVRQLHMHRAEIGSLLLHRLQAVCTRGLAWTKLLSRFRLPVPPLQACSRVVLYLLALLLIDMEPWTNRVGLCPYCPGSRDPHAPLANTLPCAQLRMFVLSGAAYGSRLDSSPTARRRAQRPRNLQRDTRPRRRRGDALAAVAAAYLTMTSIVVRGANAGGERHPALALALPNSQTPTKMPIHKLALFRTPGPSLRMPLRPADSCCNTLLGSRRLAPVGPTLAVMPSGISMF